MCVERCVARKCENATYVTMTLIAHYLEERVKTSTGGRTFDYRRKQNRSITYAGKLRDYWGKYLRFRTFSPSETCFFYPRPFFSGRGGFLEIEAPPFHSDVTPRSGGNVTNRPVIKRGGEKRRLGFAGEQRDGFSQAGIGIAVATQVGMGR